MSIKLKLPWCPSVNHFYFHQVITRPGRKPFVKKGIGGDGLKFMEKVKQSVESEFGTIRATEARLVVSVVTHAPTRRIFDLDNLWKSLLDSLTFAGLWKDDGQIDRLLIERGPPGPPHGWVDVCIERLTTEPYQQKALL